MAKINIAYLVVSCDSYSDVWNAYGELFTRFWPDCPFDKYISSNYKTYNKYGFKTILTGEDISWSYCLKKALENLDQMGYKYVIPAFDDLLLISPVDTNKVNSAISAFIKLDGNCLRFINSKCPKIKKNGTLFGEIYNYVPYRLTLGFAIWNLHTLLSLININESAWEFEKIGCERSFSYDKFYCTYKDYFHFINLIVKRKLVTKEYNKLKQLIPDINLNREQWTPKKEIFRGVFLKIFLKIIPASKQYELYKKFGNHIK